MVLELIDLLNSMAQDVKNRTGKNLLVMVDDLEMGSTDADKKMHQRLFNEYYSILIQQDFNVIYTMPVYFKALSDSRINSDSVYAFSAQRMYNPEDKKSDVPMLDETSSGYQFMTKFILQRLDSNVELFENGVLDELIRIGSGLLRDTNAAIEGTNNVILRK